MAITKTEALELRKKYGLDRPTQGQPQSQPQQGFLSNIKNDLIKRAGDVKTAFTKSAKDEQNPLSTSVQTVGAGAGFINDVIFRGIEALTPKPVKDVAKKGIQTVASQPQVADVMQRVSQWAEQHPEAAKNLESTLDIASLFPVGKGGQVGVKTLDKAIKTGVGTTKAVGKDLKTALPVIGKDVTKLLKPDPSPVSALGQVLQGSTKDAKSGIKALAAVDTKDVKTFSDLDKKMGDKISTLSKVVDSDLGADSTVKKLKDLVVSAKTKSGKVITDNPVSRALTHLEELYANIGDSVKVAEIKDAMATAKKTGLTKLDVNNLAREYGQEFGSKAFGKTGEALTSVNARLYENTRKMLKKLAREGLNGDAAKAADETISSIYRTQELIKKNIEAANKLNQRIQERGALEKIGSVASKALNLATGGTLRGFVGGMLPRGAGYKVMNAVDLEAALEKNLRIIKEALKAKNDKELMKLLKKNN